MELKAFFMGKPENAKSLEIIAREFERGAQKVGARPEYRILSVTDGHAIAGIKTKLDFMAFPEESHKALYEALLERLRVLAAVHGFVPLDDEGHIIWLLPSYGFEVYFHCPQSGRADDLYDAARQVYNELGEHMEDGQVGAIGEDGRGGEFFRVQLSMQDYLNQDDRKRLMLAAYFRLLLLARQKGFAAFNPGAGKDEEKNGDA